MKKFLATITPATIEKRDTKAGVRYSVMPNATVVKPGKGGKPTTMTRTVMAFGRENAAVANILRPGKAVQVECTFDGGTIRIVGKAPKAKTAG